MISPPPPHSFHLIEFVAGPYYIYFIDLFSCVFICWPASDAEVGKKERELAGNALCCMSSSLPPERTWVEGKCRAGIT